jgi:hypothetical protein
MISLMGLSSQSPGVCVLATCYMLCGSEIEEQAVQTGNQNNLRRLIALHGGPAMSVLCAEKMSNHADAHPQFRR